MNDVARANAFLDLFTSLPDSRQPWKIRHVLHEIIFICIAGSLCGCDDFERIEDFAHGRRKWLSRYLTLPNGIPSHDTMARAFQALDKDSFILAFLEFTKAAEAQAGQGVIAIDGKTMCGTGDSLLKPAHIVSAWFSETGMVLGQLKTEGKSNEITRRCLKKGRNIFPKRFWRKFGRIWRAHNVHPTMGTASCRTRGTVVVNDVNTTSQTISTG